MRVAGRVGGSSWTRCARRCGAREGAARRRGDRIARARVSDATTTTEIAREADVECVVACDGDDACVEALCREYDVNLRAHTRVRAVADESTAEDLSLSAYMRLPVSQYVDVPLPLGATMTRVRAAVDGATSRDEEFRLTIPGLRFLTLEVQPVIDVRVRCLMDGETVKTWHGRTWGEGQDPNEPGARPETRDVDMRGPCVLIEVIRARVEGKTVESLGLNDMFVNRGTTAFRWRSRGDGSLHGPPLTRTGFEADEDRATEKESEGACIMGWTDIGVGVDPPGPFAKLPKSLTQKVGDAVLGTTLGVLQSVFVNGLARDYHRWANDEQYRRDRANQ